MHYYPHHIGDFIADTSRLTDSQCMAYLRLIWHYYDTEKPLENDPESLAFKIGASVIDVNLILKHYFILDGNQWRKTRCDSVIAEYHGKADKARKSAEARWKNANGKQSNSERNANASNNNANEPFFDANQKPITNNQNKDKELITPQAATPRKSSKRLPEDWEITQEYLDAAILICNELNIDLRPRLKQIAHKFKDYWIAKSGKDATKADWLATWRNWIRREAENAKGGIGTTGKKSYGEQRAELFDAVTDYSSATNF